MEHVLYSVMRIASIRIDNKISFHPDITAGVFVGEKGTTEKTERVLAVEELFKDSSVRFTFEEDIVRDMWMKYAGNISRNLPPAVLGIGYGACSDSEHVNFIASALWKEVAQIVRAKGISIPEEFQLFVGAKPQARFSTLQDIDAKRHTEIDIFAGEMVRMGKALGIPWTKWDSIEEAESVIGFSFGLPEVIADSYDAVSFRTLNDKLIEVVYRDEDFEICVRKQKGESQDISGDSNWDFVSKIWEQ